MDTNSIIVYQNPVQQLFWDMVMQNPFIMVQCAVFVALFIGVYYVLDALYSKVARSIPYNGKLSFIRNYRHYSSVILLIAGVVSLFVSFFVIV